MAVSAVVATALTLEQIRKNRPDWKSVNVDFDTFQQQAKAGRYELDPPHQRNVVHDSDWKSAILSSALKAGDIPATYWHPSSKDPNVRESLDGKQRCCAILDYMNNKYAYTLQDIAGMKGKFYKDLPKEIQGELNACSLNMLVASRRQSESEIAEFFARRQETKRTTCGEHLNACVNAQLRKELTMLSTFLAEEGQFEESSWSIGDRFMVLERMAQLAYVSSKDLHKGSKTAALPRARAANAIYNVEPKILKPWWTQAVFTKSQLTDATRLIKAVLSVQRNPVKFSGTNSSKNNVMACAYYIQRFCWDIGRGTIDEDALEQFANRLINLTEEYDCITLGGVDGCHSGKVQRERLVELVNNEEENASE